MKEHIINFSIAAVAIFLTLFIGELLVRATNVGSYSYVERPLSCGLGNAFAAAAIVIPQASLSKHVDVYSDFWISASITAWPAPVTPSQP